MSSATFEPAVTGSITMMWRVLITLRFAHEEFPVPANLIESDQKRARLKAFRDRALSQPAGVFQGDEKELALLVVEAIHNLREDLVSTHEPVPEGEKTYLLLPWVTQAPGYDTGIAISNTGSDLLGAKGRSGVCTFHYHGSMANGSSPPSSQVSAVVAPGQVCTYTLYNGSSQWLLDNRGAGFSGYLVIECNFPYANAFAHIGGLGGSANRAGGSTSTGYLATVVKPNRTDE
jgi:hypothetical protein